MFKWLKKIFTKQQDYVIFKINTDMYIKNKDVISYADFYTKVGIMNIIDELVKTNEFGKYHYKNIQANSYTYTKIYDLLKYNLLNTKNKYRRIYKEKYLLGMAAADNLNWSPYTNETLKNNEIKVLLPNNKDFVQVTEKDSK